MTKSIFAAAAVALSLAAPVAADPTLGLGLTITFGNGSVDTGLGVRLFSDDEKNQAALSLGLDYMFVNQSFRPAVGVAYLMDSSYLELNGGVMIGTGEFGLGVGGGYAKTVDQSSAPAPAIVPALF